MTAEEAIAAQLDRRLGSLSAGHRHLILLEQIVPDGTGGWSHGPHTVGWVEKTSPGGVMIRLVATRAGLEARALLEEELLDVTLSHSYPPVILLAGGAS